MKNLIDYRVLLKGKDKGSVLALFVGERNDPLIKAFKDSHVVFLNEKKTLYNTRRANRDERRELQKELRMRGYKTRPV